MKDTKLDSLPRFVENRHHATRSDGSTLFKLESLSSADKDHEHALPTPIDFHRSFPSYSPTRLVSLPELASTLGLEELYVKDETTRLDLPAFKVLGASFGVLSALTPLLPDPPPRTFSSLRDSVTASGLKAKLFAATDGNHGRAVARMGALLGLPTRIYVPNAVSVTSRNLIASEEGCELVVIEGSYDDAVRAAASSTESKSKCGDNNLEEGVKSVLVQDTSWTGYEEIPLNIVRGYTTLFEELNDQWVDGLNADLVVVPVGVGSLAHAAVLAYRSVSSLSSSDHHRHEPGANDTSILIVEPTAAPCVLVSLEAGQLTTIETSTTIMPGLNCGTPSPLSFPHLLSGVDFAVSVTDEEVRNAVVQLEQAGVHAGPCGAATLAGLQEFVRRRGTLSTNKRWKRVVLIVTEGSEVFTQEYVENSASCGISFLV